MDGLLVIDKPAGPTSHDVVARMRRVLREKRVGHTGTLDPIATGVLPIVVGRATRLAQFLSGGDKTYEAVITLGFSTDSGDATGMPIAAREPTPVAVPAAEAIDRALDEFRGTFLQQPPMFSAKKIEGTRSYKLARKTRLAKDELADAPLEREPPPRPAPVSVTVHSLQVLSLVAAQLTVRVECSAGFYVRALAHDLGERLGVGAHLSGLRRTVSAGCTLADAIGLDEAERDPAVAAGRLIPLGRMLPWVPAVELTADGARRVRNGQTLGPADALKGGATSFPKTLPDRFFRLLDRNGDLVAIARPAPSGLLHPFVVLG